MRTIIRGVVALFAAFCMMDAVKAAPTIVSPADYASVRTLTDTMKNLISPLNSDVSIFSSKNTTARSNYQTEYFYNNSVPVGLSWSGTTGNCTVKVWRTNGGSESAPFFSETVSGTSTECYNLEVGCNYTWKVTDSQGNSAVGHFFTEDQAPRIIRGRRSNFTYSSGADCSNGRDIGGWATADGKRVKQGKIYRSGQLEYCSFKEGSETYQKMDMLYDVLGIRVDVDLRTVENVNAFADWKAEWDTGSANVCEWSGIGPDVERFTIEWETLGKGPSTGNPFVYDGKYGCQFPSYSAFYSDITISKKSGSTTLYSYTQTAAQNKIAVWAAFNRIYQAVVVDKEPVIFHCSHGKDRTGSLALVIHGLLGVSEANIKKDFATAWFCNPDYTFTQTSMTNMITGLKNLDTASTKTLAGGCEEYLISCATAASDNEGAAKVAAFKTAMLEEPETAAEAPLDDIGTAEEGDWGYRKTIGNEVAIVFTNHTKTVNWIVPEKLENVKFLVVGGGGGGGADFNTSSKQSPFQGGAGGGGGGVVEGLINFGEGDVVSISVGAGGNGGHTSVDTVNGAIGAGVSGVPSSIKVGAVDYVIAYGGGGDGGSNGSNDMAGNVGKSGGSSAGSRPGQSAIGDLQPAFIHESLKSTSTPYGNKGGAGATTHWHPPWYAAAGGGGGATQAGFPAASDYVGGAGGEGLISSITGEEKVYGSGGGGGSISRAVGGKGGTGAGDGNPRGTDGTAGLSALANQGGGGGGGRMGAGGNGGSGIVVLRYTTASVDPEEPVLTAVVAPTAVANLVYTGSELTGVVASDGYTLSDNTATDAGTYEATATLADGYKWSDDTTEPKKISWSIAKATNEWTTEPSISPSSWITGATPGELNMGVAKFGTVTATMNGAAFTELPTAVGTYSIVCTVEGTSNYTALSETITFEITEVPVINPTEYGTADKAASTYTWLGYTGPWMYTTNWTATASGTYGVPNNGTYATADFPAALENEFTCTLNQNVSVKYAKFDAPNMTLVIDNAALTVKDRANPSDYLAYGFGTGENASATLEFRGASAGIVSSKSEGRCMFGLEKSATDKLRCTIRFIVPASGWESTAPIRATGGDCSVYFWYDAKLVIDATALGVPAEDETKTVLLATSTDGMYNLAKTEITCADGAKGSVAVDGTKLVLTVEADETTEPEEPQLTAVVAPTAVANLVYTGSELTGVVAADGYTLTDNTATDAGTYEATATLAEGYKWSDDTTAAKTISWSIAKATNEWTTEPSISLESWTQGETAGVLTPGVAKFGDVTATMNGETFTALPTAPGTYTITYTVPAHDKNYDGLTATVTFEIKAKAATYEFSVGTLTLADGILTIPCNFVIDGNSTAAKTNLVINIYNVAEGGEILATKSIEEFKAGQSDLTIDFAELNLADGVYYFAFEVQDEAGNVLVAAEERSKLVVGELVASKPTVNYASGTKFTAIGVEQKPVVTPADGNGYTVTYEGDFTAAGTHKIVIALKDGWTWSDGTSDTLTYEYEFIERTYNDWYRATGVGRWESDSKWYTDSNLTTKWGSYPNAYDAKIICQVAGGYAHIDNGAALKIGMAEVSGQFEFKYYTMQLQNNTATPLPLWVTKEGGHSILGPVTFDLEGDGTGYFEIETGATNTFRGVTCDSELFVRYSTADSDDAIIIVSPEDGEYSSSIGWFEGGALEDTCNLVVTNSLLNFIKADAVNGVAGALAIAVHLGENNAAAPSINVAGTLNINEGSTLTVVANSMPCGVYTIINAATFNGADLLTSAAGATVTGLAENMTGELVREGNKIVLYIETTIPPRVPGIDGDPVATNAVFDTARVAKPIWYKTKPAINGDEITFNRVTVKVPEYYDVTLETLADGYLVNLKLKDNLKPFIANKVENDQIVKPAIRLENEKVYIHLENTKSDLYYTILKSTNLVADAVWEQTEGYAIGKADFEYTPAEGEAETCFFMAGDVMDEPPENK